MLKQLIVKLTSEEEKKRILKLIVDLKILCITAGENDNIENPNVKYFWFNCMSKKTSAAFDSDYNTHEDIVEKIKYGWFILGTNGKLLSDDPEEVESTIIQTKEDLQTRMFTDEITPSKISVRNVSISVYEPDWDMASSSQGYDCSFDLENSMETLNVKIRFDYFQNSKADWDDWEFSINGKQVESNYDLEQIICDTSFDISQVSQCICAVVYLLHLLNPEIDDSVLSIGKLPILTIDNYYEWEELEKWMNEIPQNILIRENLILNCEEIIDLEKFKNDNKPLQLKEITSFMSEITTDNIKSEDGGQALIYTISDDNEIGMFIKLQSWDITKKHIDFNNLVGKKIKITIEEIL